MLHNISKKLPWLYEQYQHVLNVIRIYKVNHLKKQSKRKQLEHLGKLYLTHIGHQLNWEKLETYTEKMQWEKVYNTDDRKPILADKYAVREWVASQIGQEYLIPIYGVWDSFDEIDFIKLPNQFVLKTNHGTGTVYIVKDKAQMNLRRVQRLFRDWLNTDFGYTNGLELHYSLIKPKIIAEQYLESQNGELQDYKFLCFDGKPLFCWVDMGRYSNHTRNVYDCEWNLQPWNQDVFPIYDKTIPKPDGFDKMIEIVTVLCQGFAHVRVDLYNVHGKIYFGEMSFTNGSGFDRIIPEEYDKYLGDLWKGQFSALHIK